MQEYVSRIVTVAHHYGIHAIGGMSAYIPSKDEAKNRDAMKNAREDKQREFDSGLDGCWIAHPAMADIRGIFEVIPEPHQIDRILKQATHSSIAKLVPVFSTQNRVTKASVEQNVRIAIEYLAAWISGTGAVALNGKMEDAATMEISRYNLWNQRYFAAPITDGSSVIGTVTTAVIQEIVAGQLSLLKSGNTQVPYATSFFSDAAAIVLSAILSETPPTFLTLPALAVVSSLELQKMSPAINELRHSKVASFVFGPDKHAPFGRFTRRSVRLASYRGKVLGKLIAAGDAPIVFFGAYTGPVAQQYASFGVHLYGGGWQNNAANNAQRTPYPDTLFVTPGDLYNTADLFNNYLEAAKINQELSLKEAKTSTTTKVIDYEAISVMLDGENGFGSEDKVIDMVHNLVKRGVNLIHIEDQIEKRCGHIGGKSVQKTETMRRLYEAARWVLSEIENNEGLRVVGQVRIVARTDCLDAKFFDGSANFPSFSGSVLLDSFAAHGIERSAGQGIIELLMRHEYLKANKEKIRFTSKFSNDAFADTLNFGHYQVIDHASN